ncbi:MAG: DinB family protein [Phycicoccus sp.]
MTANPIVTQEAAMLGHFLRAQRHAVVAIVDGLDETAMNTVLLPSGWTPLGLVEHLGDAEWVWFQQVAAGSPDPPPWAERAVTAGGYTSTRPVAEVLATYRRRGEESESVLFSRPLDNPPLGTPPPVVTDEVADLRWIALHMIEETARHAGHLDAVRELLDGRTGLGPR